MSISQVPDLLSDTEYIEQSLCDSVSEDQILSFLSVIKGPWTLIYYHKDSSRLYFGRDVIGRHSLLWNQFRSLNNVSEIEDPLKGTNCRSNPSLVITSVGTADNTLEEIPALGLFYLDCNDIYEGQSDTTRLKINLIPWDSTSNDEYSKFDVKIRSDNKISSPIGISLNTDIKSFVNIM